MSKKGTLAERVLGLIGPEHSAEEVNDVARALLAEVKARRAQRDRVAIVQFRSGDAVTMVHGSGRLPAGTPGRVVNLGQKNVTVDFGVYKIWRVPAGWLAKGGAGPVVKPCQGDKSQRTEGNGVLRITAGVCGKPSVTQRETRHFRDKSRLPVDLCQSCADLYDDAKAELEFEARVS